MSVAIYHHTSSDNHIVRLRKAFVESADRTVAIMNGLHESFDTMPNVVFKTQRAALESELALAHTDKYVYNVLHDTIKITGNDPDMYSDEHTPQAALFAAGAALNLVDDIFDVNSKISSGFAVVRPPGHHACEKKCSGFCYFNKVMVAALYALEKRLAFKVLVVDWDFHYHHGSSDILCKKDYTANELQVMSMHYYDNCNMFPFKKRGATGSYHNGQITNYGINVPCTDSIFTSNLAEFLNQYKLNNGTPDLILVSCGFDAAEGDPVGGDASHVTPKCYGIMTQMLLDLTPNVGLVLEGGYNVDVLPLCAQECVASLLHE